MTFKYHCLSFQRYELVRWTPWNLLQRQPFQGMDWVNHKLEDFNKFLIYWIMKVEIWYQSISYNLLLSKIVDILKKYIFTI